MQIRILPSLLAADVGRLEEGARKAEASGGDGLHIDIMDGHFVPNLSMGPAVVKMAKRCVKFPLNVHLMMTQPDRYVKAFADAGADALLIHIEADCNVPEVLETIRQRGVRPGITLNPETPADRVFDVMPKVSEVLCMTVPPGYGGQPFVREVLKKIKILRVHAREAQFPDLDILVDGGIDASTVGPCAEAGANVFVAGTSLYSAADMAREITLFRRLASKAAAT